MLTLALQPLVIGFLVVGFLLVSLLMILIVMIQRPSGGGLSEAFGSNSGSGHTAFGAKTGDALTSATIGIFILFIAGAIVLNFATRPSAGPTTAQASPAPEEQTPANTTDGGQEPGRTEVPVTQIDNPFTDGTARLVDEESLPAGTEEADTDAGDETASEPVEDPEAEDTPQ
jgi:preprotein translocase subunit SecG